MTNYDLYAVRFDTRDFKEGEEIPNSHVWVDGIETEQCLSGTCGINVEELEDVDRIVEQYKNRYAGNRIYLIGTMYNWGGYEFGEDENEIILAGAEVAKIIQ